MIFCVEDDDNIRELVIYTLETTGLEARGFADGAAFMEALAFDTPELVLLSGLLIELSPLYFDVAVSSAKEHLKKTGFTDVEFRKEGSFLYPLTTSGASLVLDNLF